MSCPHVYPKKSSLCFPLLIIPSTLNLTKLNCSQLSGGAPSLMVVPFLVFDQLLAWLLLYSAGKPWNNPLDNPLGN
jgi:hypothetical protein